MIKMKKILLSLLLLTLVLSQNQECQAYESYNSETNQCEKVCDEKDFYSKKYSSCISCNEGDIYNTETDQCEAFCQDGQVYNPETQQCDEPVCEEDQIYNSETQQCENNETPQTNCGQNQVWDDAQKNCVQMSQPEDSNPDSGNPQTPPQDEPDPYNW